MKRLLAVAAALTAVLAGCTAPQAASFTLTVSEPFNTLSTQLWHPYNGPGKGHQGPRTPANITLGTDPDGTRYVRLWTRPAGGGRYASAGLSLNAPLTYGQVNVRARSYSYGAGNKYAVMLWPVPGCWPCAETDFNESWDPARHSYMITNHFKGSAGNHGMIHHPVSLDLTRWHNFTLRWTPGLMIYSVDGHEIWRSTEHIPTVPMRLVLQTALTGAPNPVPGVLDVDYAQQWSYS